jgi:hypothetical protein
MRVTFSRVLRRKLVTAFQKLDIENRLAFNEQRLPAVIAAAQGESLQELLTSASGELRAIQLRYGAILFRGFALNRETRKKGLAVATASDPANLYIWKVPGKP